MGDGRAPIRTDPGDTRRLTHLDRLLNPRSIAVFGGDPAERAIQQCRQLGFDGVIWPVHPSRSSLGGLRAFTSVDALPGVPDAALIAVNREATLELVPVLAAMGCGGAVAHASGFAETGPDGADREAQLVAGHGMPIIGPNCYGFINAMSGAALWPDQQGLARADRGAAVITQSGNIGVNVTMNGRGLDITHLITLGNQASVTIEDCIRHLAVDASVTAIGLHIEALKDPAGFVDAARLAHAHDTPIVVLKTGRSATAAAITSSHTAALSNPADVYDALFERCHVIQVADIPEWLTVLRVLTTIGPLDGNRAVSLSCSGGEAALVADRAADHDVAFETFDAAHRERIAATLNDYVAITNPMDYHTFIWGDEHALTECFTAVMSGDADVGLLVLDWPADGLDDSSWWPTLRAIIAAHTATGLPVVVTSSLPESMPAAVRNVLGSHGIPAAYGIDEALAGVAAAAAFGRALARPAPATPLRAGRQLRPHAVLDEPTAKNLLASVGISVPASRVVEDSSDQVDLPFPLVAKAVGISHKTEAGGVQLAISSPTELRDAVTRMRSMSDRVLIEEMMDGDAVELLVSVRREPPIGIVVTIGAGGVDAEIAADTTTLLLPTTPTDIDDHLDGLRIAPALRGFRGTRSVSRKAVHDVIARLQDLVLSRPDIVEIEINPLLAGPHAATAADALISIGTVA